jgi:hypothetical protein
MRRRALGAARALDAPPRVGQQPQVELPACGEAQLEDARPGDREAVEVDGVELVPVEPAAHANVIGEPQAWRRVVRLRQAGSQPVGETIARGDRRVDEHAVGAACRRHEHSLGVAAQPAQGLAAERVGAVIDVGGCAAAARGDEVQPVGAAAPHLDRPSVVGVREPVDHGARALAR